MIEEFLILEEKYLLLERKIDDFHYWPYIRFSLYMEIENIINNNINVKKSPKDNLSVGKILKIIRNCTWRHPLLKLRKKDIVIISHQRKVKEEEYYKCVYTDFISERFHNSSVTLEFMYNFDHYEPTKLENLFYLDYIDIFAFIEKTLKSPFYEREKSKIKEEAILLNSIITQELGIDLGVPYFQKLTEKRFFWYRFKKERIKKLLKKINPKILIETVGYETNKLIINEVCDELNICTVELQHGVMGKGHLAYNFKSKNKYSFFPKKVFLFSDYWKKVTRLPIHDDNAITVGFPYFEKNIERYPSTWDDRKLNIIIISQPEFSNKLISFIERFVLTLSKSNLEYNIIYKLHPAEYASMDTRLLKLAESQNFELINNNEKSIYYYFSKSNVQIGVTSTAIYEGLAYGLNTYIYHIEKTDNYMKDLVDNGSATFFVDEQQLFEIISNINLNHKNDKSAFFWEKGSTDKITLEIDMLLKEKTKQENGESL